MLSANRCLAVLLMIAPAILANLAWGADPVRFSVTDRIWERSITSDSLRIELPDRWLIPESVIATVENDTLRAGVDYEVEPNEGIVRLKQSLTGRDLRIRYRVVPLAIGRVFQTVIPPDTAMVSTASIPPRAAKRTPTPERSTLELRGSKTISLEVGSSQDLTVRQSLDVSLAGELVEGVTVRGVLSDRETPLQAEGRTTELSDLDRIYLQVDGPGASMRLGDFQLDGPRGLFTGYERQLEGILLKGRRGQSQMQVAAATVPGEYLSAEFLATEGKQGPYDLRPAGATIDAVILAGSETVWLDGERLTRGEDRDYVIDYAASTITFTGRRMVGNASRITVDLQISSQPYRRNAYSAEIGWGAYERSGAHGTGLRATFLTERDDRSRPIGGPLTDRERDLLEQAGDSLTTDLASGVDCGESGYGDYQWVEADSLDRPFLRFIGASEGGTCRVRFDDVGERRGDYADSLLTDGRTIYRYVGYRNGRFLPGRAVPRPSRRDLLDIFGVWSGPSGLQIEAEAAGSIDDPNTLSDLDDDDRVGGALRLRLARETRPLHLGGVSVGKWGVALESRDLEDRFRPISRIDPSWYGYDWGIAADRLQRGDRRRSVALKNEPGLGLALSGSYETLSNRRDLDGTRSRLLVQRSGRLRGSLQRSRANTVDSASGREIDGSREIDDAKVGLNLSRVEGGLGFRRERGETGSGDARTGNGFDEWSWTAAYLLPPAGGRLEVVRTERTDRITDQGAWRDHDKTKTLKTRAIWSSAGRVLEAQYTRRDLLRSNDSDVRSDLAGLLWSQVRSDGRFSQQIRADLNTTSSDQRIKSIEFVGEGRGRYDSLGVYVGIGDYDLLLLPSGATDLQRRFEASWRIDLAPGRGKTDVSETALGKIWNSSQWLLYGKFSSRTEGSAGDFWEELPNLLLATSEGVPLASHKIRAEASALPGAKWASPQLRLRRERAQENLFENVQTERLRDFVSVTLRSLPASGWSTEQEFQFENDEEVTKLTSGSGGSGSIGWRSLYLRLGGWWRPNKSWTVRLGVTGRDRERIGTGQAYNIAQIAPGLQWVPRARTRIDLRLTRTLVDGPKTVLLGLEKQGWEARWNVSVRLHGSLDASIVGDFVSPDGAASRASTRAELRALF